MTICRPPLATPAIRHASFVIRHLSSAVPRLPRLPLSAPTRWPRLRLPTLSRGDARYLRLLYADARRPLPPAPARPEPAAWSNDGLTAAWLGHSTVLLNVRGLWVLTDPVLGRRVGIQIGPTVVGMRRLVLPALSVRELPAIDLVLLSHAHMDHWDTLTLGRLARRRTQRRKGGEPPRVICPAHTRDLLPVIGGLRRHATELAWDERDTLSFPDRGRDLGPVEVRAFAVRHWGARMRHDEHRGYNGYTLRHAGVSVLFAGDTAYAPQAFAALRPEGPFDLALMPIGAYDPWIGNHCTPEQAVAMADAAGARAILPIHHQTFKLSREDYDEPIRRFEQALVHAPERIAVRRIGESFLGTRC